MTQTAEIETPLPHACTGCGLSRRAVLAAAGAVGAVAALAACGSTADDGGSTPSQPGTPPGTGSPAEPGETPGDDETTDGSSDAIARVADVPVGGAVTASVGGEQILITQPQAGTIVGLSAVCTHEGCAVSPADDQLRCPCHGSTFALDGAVLNGPARADLPTVALRVEGDEIFAA